MKNTSLKQSAIIIYFIVFLITVIPALFLHSPSFEDGLGTMGAAAYITGYDWSDFLAADGFYYKYGQALWYLGPFICIGDAVLRYKIMIIINSILVSFIPVIALCISVKYMFIERDKAVASSFVLGVLPCILLNSKYTWAETNLMLIPWIVWLILLKIFVGDSLKKLVWDGALACVAVYAFMSHQRGVVVVIATTMTYVFFLSIAKFDKKWKHLSVYCVSLVCMLVVDRICDSLVKFYVYDDVKLAHNTLADFLYPEIYQKLFSSQGCKVVVATILGWLYNVSFSTFGIALFGSICMLIIAITAVKGKEITAEAVLAVQGFLCFAGAFALGILFFFKCLYGYWDGSLVERCDHLLFGRYLESSIPMLFFMGVVYLLRSDGVRKLLIWITTVQLVILLESFYLWIMPKMDGVNCYVHSLMSMNLFMDTSQINTTLDYVPNIGEAVLWFGVCSVFIWICFVLLPNKYHRFILAVICLVCLLIYFNSFKNVIYRLDKAEATVYSQIYLLQ